MKTSNLQFTDPHIVKLEFGTNENFNENIFNGFAIEQEVEKKLSISQNLATVHLYLKVGDNNDCFPFYFKIEMCAEFKYSGSREKFELLLKTNAPALLLSYTRPLISLISSQSGYPSLNIPFMDFT